MSGANAKRTAQLNDQLRAALGLLSDVPGMMVMTLGIANLPDEAKLEVLQSVRDFSDFTEDNDPYGEHDFGAFNHHLAGKIFWKIDYYSDEDCEIGSPDPASTDLSYRVLTIMLADEY